MNKEEQNLNNTQKPKLGISDVMYRLFWYSIFLIIPYLFISFFVWDITWITSTKMEIAQNFSPIKMFYGIYGIIMFVPVVIIGVYTPKGMRDCGGL
jgi:hypothetical protein